jgi:hypothetical protein
MKSLFVAIAAVLLPLGFASVAWAGELNVAQDMAPVDRSDANALGTQEVGIRAEEDVSAERLDTLSTQINQDVNGEEGQTQSGDQITQSVSQFLSLPRGLVIRGTSFGGLAVGGEF